ncbi:MAG: hypothetical protein WC807_18610 [Hyphomicrobium sp.]
MKRLVVKQDGEQEVTVEVLASSIVAISEGIKKLRAGRLNDKALMLLIQNACPATGTPPSRPAQKEIRAVLDGMAALEATYLKKAPSK